VPMSGLLADLLGGRLGGLGAVPERLANARGSGLDLPASHLALGRGTLRRAGVADVLAQLGAAAGELVVGLCQLLSGAVPDGLGLEVPYETRDVLGLLHDELTRAERDVQRVIGGCLDAHCAPPFACDRDWEREGEGEPGE